MRQRLVPLAGVVLLACFSSASFAADEAATSLNDTITVDGLPPQRGRIFFFVDDDEFVGVRISKDGKFKLKHIPPGKYKVSIEGDGILPKYQSEVTSGLAVELKTGGTELEFVLRSN